MKVNMTTLKKYYGLGNFARILKALPELSSPAMNLIYPESKRQQWQSPILPKAELSDLSGNVPVVRRGTSSYSVNGNKYAADFIEPQPIYLNRFTTAKEINDLLSTGFEANINMYLSAQVDILRRKTRRATEIMCAQSLNGLINYKIQNENGGLEAYQVSYGTVASLTAVDIASANAGDIYKYFEALFAELSEKGYTGNVATLAGTNVYARLVTLAADTKNTVIVADKDGIMIAGKFRVVPATWSYILPGDTSATTIIAANKVKMIDLSAPHTLYYCALDDLDNNLAAMPFLVKPKESEDPDGVKNISNSKPLPVPVLDAIIDQQMLSA